MARASAGWPERARLGTATAPDVTVAGEPTPVLGLLLGMLDLAAAKAAGVDYQGSSEVLERLRGVGIAVAK